MTAGVSGYGKVLYRTLWVSTADMRGVRLRYRALRVSIGDERGVYIIEIENFHPVLTLSLKKRIHFENTPSRIPTSHIPQFLLWQVHRQVTRLSMERVIDHFLTS